MAWQNKGMVAIAGVGFSPIERRTTTPLGHHALSAARSAVADCGLSLEDIDGLATYPPAPFLGAANVPGEDIIPVEFFLSRPEIGQVTWYSEAGAGLIPTAVQEAAYALISGACSYVLVWRAMYVPPGTYGRIDGVSASGDEQFRAPYGCVSPIQWHALAYRRYMELSGATRESVATLAVNSRKNANMNDHAVFNERGLSHSDYMSSRMISDPICLYDCDVPVTACVAMVMTTGDRARALKHSPAYLAAIAQQTVNRNQLISYTLHDHVESGAPMVQGLWRDAGIGPSEIAAAELYDGFSPSALYWLEAAGFCDRGEGHAFIQDGRIEIGGELPVNTFGGSLSQGRLHGMGHIAEAVLQVSGRGGPRQVADADAVIVLDGSPMLRGGGLILTSEP